jgi:hypothetical protein
VEPIVNGFMKHSVNVTYTDVVTPGEESDQKLGELLLVVTSFVLVFIIIPSHIIVKMVSLYAFSIEICFTHNIVLYNTPSDLVKFFTEILLLFYASASNIGHFLDQREAAQLASNRAKKFATQNQHKRLDKK